MNDMFQILADVPVVAVEGEAEVDGPRGADGKVEVGAGDVGEESDGAFAVAFGGADGNCVVDDVVAA